MIIPWKYIPNENKNNGKCFVCFNLYKNSASQHTPLFCRLWFIFSLQPAGWVLFVCDHQQQIKLQEGKKTSLQITVCVIGENTRTWPGRLISILFVRAELSAAPLYARALGCVHRQINYLRSVCDYYWQAHTS